MGTWAGSVGPWPPETPADKNPYEKDRWVKNNTELLNRLYPGVDHRTFLMQVPFFDATRNKMFYPGGSKAYWEAEEKRRRIVQTAFDARATAAAQQAAAFTAEGLAMANGSQTIGATGTLQIGETFKKYLPLILIAGIVFFIVMKK